MELDGFAHEFFELLYRVCRTDATGQIWHIRGKIGSCIFDNDGVFNHLKRLPNPAWRTMLARISLGRSLLGCPDTVTVPGFVW